MSASEPRNTPRSARLSHAFFLPLYELFGAAGYETIELDLPMRGRDRGTCNHARKTIRLPRSTARILEAMLDGAYASRPTAPSRQDRFDRSLQRLADSLHAAFHEGIHSMTPSAELDEKRMKYADDLAADAVFVMSEGLAELISHTYRNEFHEAVGADELAPELSSVDAHVAYVPQLLAMREFASALGTACGMGQDDLLSWLAMSGGKPVGVGAVLGVRISRRVPEDVEHEVVSRILRAVSVPLILLEYQLREAGDPSGITDDPDLRALGVEAGRDAGKRLVAALGIVDHVFSDCPGTEDMKRYRALMEGSWTEVDAALEGQITKDIREASSREPVAL